VGANDCGIKNQNLQIRLSQCSQDGVPTSLRGPTIESSPLAVGIAKSLGEIRPGDTGPSDIQDGIDEEAIVAGDASMLTLLAWEKVLYPVPISIANRVSMQHEQPSIAKKRTAPYPQPLLRVHTT
jgi:hypothetical protein